MTHKLSSACAEMITSYHSRLNRSVSPYNWNLSRHGFVALWLFPFVWVVLCCFCFWFFVFRFFSLEHDKEIGLQGRPKTPKPIQGAANGTKNRTPHIRPRTTRATPALSLQRILLASCLCLCFGRHHLQARHNKAAYHKPQTSSMRTESLITYLALKQQTQWHPPVQTPAAKTLSAVP